LVLPFPSYGQFSIENAHCFTCESFQHVLAIAILSIRPSICLSVRPSVTRVDQSKVVQAKITKSSQSAAWKTLVWPISHCISVTVGDRA